MVGSAGFEPATSCLQGRRRKDEHTSDATANNHHGVDWWEWNVDTNVDSHTISWSINAVAASQAKIDHQVALASRTRVLVFCMQELYLVPRKEAQAGRSKLPSKAGSVRRLHRTLQLRTPSRSPGREVSGRGLSTFRSRPCRIARYRLSLTRQDHCRYQLRPDLVI